MKLANLRNGKKNIQIIPITFDLRCSESVALCPR